MDLALKDLRHALRALLRRPGFTAVALVTLAVGMFGVSASDPWALLGMAALLTAVVLVASSLPARAAARTDPLHALRHD